MNPNVEELLLHVYGVVVTQHGRLERDVNHSIPEKHTANKERKPCKLLYVYIVDIHTLYVYIYICIYTLYVYSMRTG